MLLHSVTPDNLIRLLNSGSSLHYIRNLVKGDGEAGFSPRPHICCQEQWQAAVATALRLPGMQCSALAWLPAQLCPAHPLVPLKLYLEVEEPLGNLFLPSQWLHNCWELSAFGSGDAAGPCWASVEASSTVGSLSWGWGRQCCPQHMWAAKWAGSTQLTSSYRGYMGLASSNGTLLYRTI